MAGICQRTCIVVSAVFGVIAGLALLIIGVAARYAYMAARTAQQIVKAGIKAGRSYQDYSQDNYQDYSQDNQDFDNIDIIENAFSIAQVVVYALIVLGCITTVANFIGCYGSLCENLCLTYIYFGSQIGLMIVSIVITIYIFIAQDKLVTWFQDKSCGVCAAFIVMSGFAWPIGGLCIVAALVQALNIYCAWVVAKNIKDGTLGKGKVFYVAHPTTLTTVVAGGPSANTVVAGGGGATVVAGAGGGSTVVAGGGGGSTVVAGCGGGSTVVAGGGGGSTVVAGGGGGSTVVAGGGGRNTVVAGGGGTTVVSGGYGANTVVVA